MLLFVPHFVKLPKSQRTHVSFLTCTYAPFLSMRAHAPSVRGNMPGAPDAMLKFHLFHASLSNAIVSLFLAIFIHPEWSASVTNSVISNERQVLSSIIIVRDSGRRSRLNICIFLQRHIFAHRFEVQSFVFITIFSHRFLCDNESAKQMMNQSGEEQRSTNENIRVLVM